MKTEVWAFHLIDTAGWIALKVIHVTEALILFNIQMKKT